MPSNPLDKTSPMSMKDKAELNALAVIALPGVIAGEYHLAAVMHENVDDDEAFAVAVADKAFAVAREMQKRTR